MRWIPLLAIFLYVYIEISVFIQVAHVLGVLLTLVLVILTSSIGISLVRNQGLRNFIHMQKKIESGENPAKEMVKSISIVIAGFLLLIPGFFTDFLGLLFLLPPVQKLLTLRLLPHLRFTRAGGGFGADNGHTFEGEYQRKDEVSKRLEDQDRDDR